MWLLLIDVTGTFMRLTLLILFSRTIFVVTLGEDGLLDVTVTFLLQQSFFSQSLSHFFSEQSTFFVHLTSSHFLQLDVEQQSSRHDEEAHDCWQHDDEDEQHDSSQHDDEDEQHDEE